MHSGTRPPLPRSGTDGEAASETRASEGIGARVALLTTPEDGRAEGAANRRSASAVGCDRNCKCPAFIHLYIASLTSGPLKALYDIKPRTHQDFFSPGLFFWGLRPRVSSPYRRVRTTGKSERLTDGASTS